MEERWNIGHLAELLLSCMFFKVSCEHSATPEQVHSFHENFIEFKSDFNKSDDCQIFRASLKWILFPWVMTLFPKDFLINVSLQFFE